MIIRISTSGDGRIDLEMTSGGHWSSKELTIEEARALRSSLSEVIRAAENGDRMDKRIEA